jgi:tripartite-type tricarboxylate transporter receptor subunit TctC
MHSNVSRLLAVLALAWSACCAAQQYPTRPVVVICPYGGGSGADIIARVVSDHFSKSLGQSVVVENRPGASSMIAHEYVAKQPPDGYTLIITGDQVTTLPIFFKDWKLDALKDFTMAAIPYTATILVMTGGQEPFKSIGELITYAKANPGKLNFAFVGPGPYVVAFRYMNQFFGLGMTEINFKGTADARTSAMRNELQLFPDTLAGTQAMIQNGSLRPLAVIRRARLDALPDVPTINEGALAQLKLDADETWAALAGPANMPADVVNKINTTMNAAVRTPEYAEAMRKFGLAPKIVSPAEARDITARDLAKWASIAKTIGMQPN